MFELKYNIFFAILISTVLLAGCSSGSFGGSGFGVSNNGDGSSDFDPHVGSQGLEMHFVLDQPPAIIYDTDPLGSNFPVMVEVWNRGAADIDYDSGSPLSGYLILSGVETNTNDVFQKLGNFKIIDGLKGKSAYNTLGGYKIFDFGCSNADYLPSCSSQEATVSLPKGVSEFRPNLQVTACYEYETQASPTLCIDKNPYSGLNDKPCKAGQIDMTGSQGAPVAVSHIEQISMPDAIQLRIEVSNVGGGTVVKRSSIATSTSSFGDSNFCPYDLGFEDLNRVEYSLDLLGDSYSSTASPSNIDCEPSPNKFRLTNGRGTIFCTVQINSVTSPVFQTPLVINLKYGYMQSVSKPVTIRNLKT